MVVERLRGVHLLQLAIAQDANPVPKGHRLHLVVRDVDGGDGQAVVQLAQRRAHRDAQLRVQVGQRLVHEEGARLPDDRPAHRHPLPLPAGQRGGLALEVLADAQHPGHLVDPPGDLRLRRLALLQAERQVLLHRHVRVERVVLEHHRDVAVLGRQVVHHAPADRDRPRGDLLQARDRAQRGGLATAGRTDQDHELAVADLQAEVVDPLDPSGVDLADPVKDDLGHARAPSSRPRPCPGLLSLPGAYPSPPDFGSTAHPACARRYSGYGDRVEEIDRKILLLLAQDGRMSFTDLARQTGLSVSATHQRVRRLERRGLIRGYVAVIDPADAGLPLTAFVSIKPFDPAAADDAPERLAHLGAIEACHSVAGDENYILKVRVASPAALENLLSEIRAAANVSTRTTIVLSTPYENRTPDL